MRGVALAIAALMALMTVPAATAGPDQAFAGEPDEVRNVLRAVADEIDGQNVYDCIDEITKDAPYSYRLMGTPTKDMFLEKYSDAFSQYGLKSEIQYFNIGKRPWDPQEGPAGANLVGVYEGNDPTKWVVMGGHYDTQAATQGGGAHDNASGICTVQEIARTVAELGLETEATWVFAWWDGEEWGLYGSQAFVQDHNQTKGMLDLTADTEIQMLQGISIDMAGLVWPAHNPWAEGGLGLVPGAPQIPAPKQHFHLRAPPVDVNESWASWSYGSYEELKTREDFEEILQDFRNFRGVVEEVWRVWLEVPEEHVSFEEDSYGRTDHIPFMAAGVPGLRIQGAHDGEYPCYHQPCDTLEFMTAAAGSQDLLIQGMDMETTTTALISTYLAMKGDVVAPGTNTSVDDGNGTTLDDPEAGIPAPGALVLTVGLLAAALAWRRRL